MRSNTVRANGSRTGERPMLSGRRGAALQALAALVALADATAQTWLVVAGIAVLVSR